MPPSRTDQGSVSVADAAKETRKLTQQIRVAGGRLLSHELLASVIDNLPDCVYVKDLNGRYLASNSGHRKILGEYELSAVLGKTIYDFLPLEMADKVSQLDRQVLDNYEEIYDREILLELPDGSQRWESITKVPLILSDGSMRGLVGITKDVTERRLAEEKLVKANHELEASRQRLVQALTDLRRSNDSMQRMQEQLIEVEKHYSVGRLASGVAHEVKNPLAIIKSGLEFIESKIPEKSADIQTAASEMHHAIERAETIVRDLLDFAADRGLDLEECDINSLVNKTLSLMGYSLGKSKIKVTRKFAADLPRPQVDRAKIEQVLINILLNAVQAIGSAGGVIEVATYSSRASTVQPDDEGIHGRFVLGHRIITIEIHDSGPGIPSDKLRSIFDPFFTTRATGGGTGLGLSVSRRIIQQHRGTLDMTNHPEGGAVAIITLPEY